jgi:hypothetical protein
MQLLTTVVMGPGSALACAHLSGTTCRLLRELEIKQQTQFRDLAVRCTRGLLVIFLAL